MKKLIPLFLFIYTLSSSGACPEGFSQNIYTDLQSDIRSITWLDVNEKNSPDKCEFAVRYYPCSNENKNQLNSRLPNIIQNNTFQCSILNHGKHVHTDGYCTLKNIALECESF